jgi:hypothetical protein
MEAMYYTSTRSSRGLHPCPKCLVPSSELRNIADALDGKYEQRTTLSMKTVYENSLRLQNARAREDLLKRFGLHDVEVRSDQMNSDVV